MEDFVRCLHDLLTVTAEARAEELLAFVRRHGHTYPSDVQPHFDHGRIKSWGADLNLSNHLLGGCIIGLLRVVRRAGGTRIYETVKYSPRQASTSLLCDEYLL